MALPLQCYQLVTVQQVQEETGSDDINTRSKRQIDPRLPDHLEFTLQSETSSSRTTLKLSRLPEIPTYVFTDSGLEKHSGELENKAVYSVEDDKIGVIQVKRTNNSTSDSANSFELEGEFVEENKIYQIHPAREESGRSDRTDDGPKNLYHKVFNRQEDYRKPMREEGRYRRSVKEYTIELCYIIDAEDFQKRFLPRNNNDEDEAVSDARIFYSYVSEQIRLRYISTYEVDLSFMFKFVITGLVILKNRSDSEFLEDLVQKGTNRGIVEYNDGLDAAIEWLYIHENSLPPSDHYMFFTSYDLADVEDTDSLGLANLGSMCLRDEDNYPLSASIIENGFDANVGATAAHELGHCLNADHDTDAGCDDGDLYLMSERSLHPKNPEQASNPWKLSNCSVRDMLLYLKTENVSCLSDTKSNTDSLREMQVKDGVYYSLGEQCRMAFGAGSQFCQGKYTNPASNATFCYKVYCTDSKGKCEPIFPRDYTKCGNDHWCYKGECIKASAEDFQMELEGDDTEIDIPQDTVEVLSHVKYTKSSPGDVIVFNYQWNPEFADSLFHFNISNGRITVKTGALFNITEAEVFITATTNETYTTLPISIMIYIYNESYTPKFAQERFVVQVTSLQMKSAEKALVVMSDVSQLLLEGDQKTDFKFLLQNSQHSNLVRLDEKQVILDAEKLRQEGLSNFIVTIEAIFKNILSNFTTVEFIFDKSIEDSPKEKNNHWLIPVIIVSIFAVGGFLIFVIIQIRQCRNPSSPNFDKPSSPLPTFNPTTDANDGGNLSPVFTPLYNNSQVLNGRSFSDLRQVVYRESSGNALQEHFYENHR
ncbi:hypothetical protein LOTGIDRAFT_239598 [Lottia gigantea]|uniref:Peptidase M12B domain-containing protein n=1 Tax=Lottia gigantea TaxID=225164 RepID=V4A9H4_LOTGI|nr:hypothetical protein LOTGIDRAFT_239598 [Lottia gigantea]ESO91730.1 hypothetical protein LOTGIDRAFT_239598 [Lottia gigantea]